MVLADYGFWLMNNRDYAILSYDFFPAPAGADPTTNKDR